MEARLGALEPFIERALRPDLSHSALRNEEDLGPTRSKMYEAANTAKRALDTKPRES
jgi:hypothetical protein